jgi:hypothetical protein
VGILNRRITRVVSLEITDGFVTVKQSHVIQGLSSQFLVPFLLFEGLSVALA